MSDTADADADTAHATTEPPVEHPVDEDPGLPIPATEEQARSRPSSAEEEAKAAEVAADEAVVGNTAIGGTGGGVRFFGADEPTL
ncbi:MAG TPA: hypothetical protein VGO92_14170 [Acidimicrobiales bacterium]|jgi:hypothetical protein|nr:hypothetical protein [Acidimicrobiales bacterium]